MHETQGMTFRVTTEAPQLRALAAEARAAALAPAQLEQDLTWLCETDHGPGISPGAIGVWRGGALVGYVPFRRRETGVALRMGRLRLARPRYPTLQLFGSGVVATSDDVARAALAGLSRVPLPFLAVTLEQTPAASPVWRAIEAGAAAGFERVERERTLHHVVELGDGAVLSSKTRATFRRKERALARALGPIGMRVVTTPEDAKQLLGAIEETARKTYHVRLLGRDLTRDNERMQRNLVSWAAHGWLRAYLLTAGTSVVAFVIGFQHARTFFYEIPGYDPNQAATSPGMLLLLHIIEDLARTGAADRLDFGQGDAPYKRMLATRSFGEVSAMLIRPGVYTRAIAGADLALRSSTRVGARVLEAMDLKGRVNDLLRRVAG